MSKFVLQLEVFEFRVFFHNPPSYEPEWFYRVNTKSSPPPATFVDISAVSANFYMKFYVTLKQSNIHFITKFG